MLVLRRNVGEVVVLSRPDGTEIGRIMVVDVQAGKARLGFTMPEGIVVDRLEVYESRLRSLQQTKERSHAEGQAKCETCRRYRATCVCG